MNSEDRKEDEKTSAMSNFATELSGIEKEDKEAKKAILIKGIKEREKINKKTLHSSKMLTEALSHIRTEAGQSAFVGTSGKIKSPKFRRKEFIKLLARELLIIGHDEFEEHGNLISKARLETYFAETRPNWSLRENDILEAIDYLVNENLIPHMEKLDKNLDMIQFVAKELSTDGKEILIASQGIIPTISQLATLLNWEPERVRNAIDQLISDGLAIQEDENVYFPGL